MLTEFALITHAVRIQRQSNYVTFSPLPCLYTLHYDMKKGQTEFPYHIATHIWPIGPVLKPLIKTLALLV